MSHHAEANVTALRSGPWLDPARRDDHLASLVFLCSNEASYVTGTTLTPTFFRTPVAFRAWLATNHAKADELWVGFYKKDSGRPSLTWPESVDEALCAGWIDGIRKRIDDVSYMIRFTPRKAGSVWSRVNIGRAQALITQRRMRPAGLEAYEARQANKAGIYSYEQRPADLPAPYARLLKREKAAWAFFADQPPYYRKVAAWWIVSAKKEETRLTRLEKLAACSARGTRLPEFTLEKPLQATVHRLVVPRSRGPAPRRSPGADVVSTSPAGRPARPVRKGRMSAAAAPKTVDAYLSALSDEKRAALQKLRRDIQAAAPRAEECISYGIPGFRLDGKVLVHFGAAARHCAFYPGAVIAAFEDELAGYDTSKGTIRFAPDRPLPATLVRTLVKAQMARRTVRHAAGRQAV